MILVFCSPDPMMARHQADKRIKKDFPTRDEFNYVSFNMAVTPLRELAEECEYVPLGTDRKCVLATDCAFMAKSKTKFKYAADDNPQKLIDYCKNPNSFIDLYLLVHSEAVDEKNPLVAAIMKTGEIKIIPIPKRQEWVEYAKRYLAHHGCDADMDALNELVARVDGDYGRFIQDLAKLACYSNGEKVTKNVVTMMIAPKVEDDIFLMSNALTKGDVARALAIYRDLKSQNLDEVRLINMLSSQFAFMDEVMYLDGKGFSANEIARELATSPRRVEITVDNLYRIKPDALGRILDELYSCEKDIFSGTVTPEFAFSRFLANYSL